MSVLDALDAAVEISLSVHGLLEHQARHPSREAPEVGLVAQGPIERRYGLGTLVIYTAGTDHAKVALGGLEHGRALRIREHLLPSESSDAV